jgi:hypothetical protein
MAQRLDLPVGQELGQAVAAPARRQAESASSLKARRNSASDG